MNRPALVILALWAIVAAPVLCTAGVLAHDCECPSGAICEHETDCERDPCSEQVFRRDGSQDTPLPDAGHETPATSPVAAGLVPEPLPSGFAPAKVPDVTPPPGVRHESDLPLLI